MKAIGWWFVIMCFGALPAAGSESPIVGTWESNIDNLPVLTLTVKPTGGGQLSGTMVTYRVLYDAGSPRAEVKETMALVDPKVEGKILSFQVKGADGEPVRYQMELTGPDEGTLKGKMTQSEGAAPPALKMTRKR